MSEVSCRVFVPLVEHLHARGQSPDLLVEGLPFSAEDLNRPSNRIPWEDFVVVLERATRLLGGVEQIEQLAYNSYPKVMGIIGVLASNFVSTRSIYHIGAKWHGPNLFSCTSATCEDLPDGRVREIIEILPPHRDSELFFRLLRGSLRSAPSVFGQPDAAVEMEIHPRRAIYTITLPPPLNLLQNLFLF